MLLSYFLLLDTFLSFSILSCSLLCFSFAADVLFVVVIERLFSSLYVALCPSYSSITIPYAMIESYANEWPVLSECVLSLYQRTLCRLNWIVRCVCARVRREPHLSEWQIFYSYVPLDALHTQSISSFFLYCFILCGFSCWFFVVVVTSAHVLVVVARSSMRNQVKTNGFHKNKRWKRDCRTNEPEERDHGCVAIGQQRFLLLFHYVLGYVLVSSPAFDLWRNENVRKTWGTEEDAAAWRGKDEKSEMKRECATVSS